MMKKTLLAIVCAALLMSSCGTYTATGAYTGGHVGHIVGSAVGGISGGWRGHELGSLIGTVGGAVAGAAIGSAADRAQQRKYERAERQRNEDRYEHDGGYYNRGYDRQGGYDPQGRGDDRISFYDERTAAIEVRNVQIVENRRDGLLTRGEELTVVFEIFNHSDRTLRDIRPLVEETTRNRHIHISPGLRVDHIDAHQGVRYTARVLADNGLRSGGVVLRVGVAQGGRLVESQVYDYQVPTAKRPR